MARLAAMHFPHRVGCLSAAALVAYDGIVSTSLIVGVATADASRSGVMVAGAAGLEAGKDMTQPSQPA